MGQRAYGVEVHQCASAAENASDVTPPHTHVEAAAEEEEEEEDVWGGGGEEGAIVEEESARHPRG